MKFHVFKNFTIEHLFKKGCSFSDYDEFTIIPSEADFLIWFYILPLHVDKKDAFQLMKNYLERIQILLSRSGDNQAMIVMLLSSRLAQLNLENSENDIIEAVEHFNNNIISLSKEHNRVKWIDIDDFFKDFSNRELMDWKFYYISKMIINPKLSHHFIEWFEQKIDAINFKRKKCLILDLDNTLWGGVLGEDGIDGIKLGGDYPGNAYKDFQMLIQRSTSYGVLLAICSKNNFNDVRELWENHPEIILKESDFASLRINWSDKAKNIVEISQELNIGPDSFVFLDDNPGERERVKSELPMVEVPEFPEEPYDLPKFFEEIYKKYFQVYKLTSEDYRKTEQYRENANRNKLLVSVSSMDEFIRNLEIELSVFMNKNIPRVAQMTQKTNQFNLTTRRYTDSDILQFLKEGHLIFSMGVKDKFGDSGITAAAIVLLNKNNHSAHIDSFLLSCRILGKKIEHVFLQVILNELFNIGIKVVYAAYMPTAKNIQTVDFYDKNSFQLTDLNNGEKRYKLEIIEQIEINNSYTLKFN